MKKGEIAAVVILVAVLFILAVPAGLYKNVLTGFVSFGNILSPFASVSTVGTLFLDLETTSMDIRIHSPLNITYNFSKDSNYTLDLHVSSKRNVILWWYTLLDLRHNRVIYEDVSFEPNITFNAVRWNNTLTVFGRDDLNRIYNSSVSFFVFVNNSAPILGEIPPNIYLCENNYLSQVFSFSDIDEDLVTCSINPQFPQNPFYISSANNVNFTSGECELFSGILSKSDSGGTLGYAVYPETVSVDDSEYSDSAATNITVIGVNNYPLIEDIGARTVWTRGEDSNFYYQVFVSDVEDGNSDAGNLSFHINFSSGNLFGITNYGIMNFTPSPSQVGVYNITLAVRDNGLSNPYFNISRCGQDGGPLTSYREFSLTVTDENRGPIIVSYSPENLSHPVSGIVNLEFNLTSYDPDGTIPDISWYVDGVLQERVTGNLSDTFIYNFGCGIYGFHNVLALVSDGLLQSSVQWNLTVQGTDCEYLPPGTGGGGGGGDGGLICEPKWACTEWESCTFINSPNNLSFQFSSLIKDRCSMLEWKNEFCGFQIRNCTDLEECKTNVTKPGVIMECYYIENPSCDDLVKNCHNGSCEVLPDCGGPCPPCPTCSDEIQNQGEEGIDCGGPCISCAIEKPFNFFSKKNITYTLVFLIILIILIVIIVLLIRYLTLARITKRIKQ